MTCGSDGVGAMEEAQDLQAGGEAVAYSERITWPTTCLPPPFPLLTSSGAMEEALQDPQACGEAVAYSERITWPKLKVLMKVPTNWLVVLQGLPGSISWGVFNTYFNDYLQIKNGWDAGVRQEGCRGGERAGEVGEVV